MEKYIGTKTIKAKKCSIEEAVEFLGKPIAASEPNIEVYVVEYKDGYRSWSPVGPFEDAYRPTDGLTFGIALELMKQGKKVARKGWNGAGMSLQYQFPDKNSKMSLPHLYLTIRDGAQDCEEGERRLPWQPAQVDMHKEDWFMLD